MIMFLKKLVGDEQDQGGVDDSCRLRLYVCPDTCIKKALASFASAFCCCLIGDFVAVFKCFLRMCFRWFQAILSNYSQGRK